MADTTAKQDSKALALTNNYARQRDSLALALIKALLGLWGSFGQYDDWDLAAARAARSAVLVDASLAKSRRLARAYAGAMMRNLDVYPTTGLPPVQELYPRSGVTTTEVWSRPIEQYRYALSRGLTEKDARDALEERVRDLADMDVKLVARDEVAKVYASSPKIIGRRRIIHPELSASGFSCGLCVVISTRMYHHIEKTAVHDGCNCTEGPVTAGFDPGLKLNRADLDAFYATAGGSAFADDLRDLSVRVDEHGELGPILRNADHAFRGPESASTSRHRYTPFEEVTPEAYRDSLRTMIEQSQRAIIRLKAARDAGAASTTVGEGIRKTSVSDYATAIGYYDDLVSRYTKRLAA
jgi:hypothetical protein